MPVPNKTVPCDNYCFKSLLTDSPALCCLRGSLTINRSLNGLSQALQENYHLALLFPHNFTMVLLLHFVIFKCRFDHPKSAILNH